MSVEIVWEPRGVARTFRGHATGRDALESFKLIAGHPHFDELRYNLMDFTAVTDWTTTDEELQLIGALTIGPGLSNPHLQVLIVTDRDDLRDVAERYVALGLSPYPHEFFTHLGDARRWIERNIPRNPGPAGA